MSIRSFRDKATGSLHEGFAAPRWRNIERVARRKLTLLDAAPSLNALRVPPGNHLEELKGDRKGQHSIRVNDQWRLCFVWHDGDAHDVEICDYHLPVHPPWSQDHDRTASPHHTRRDSTGRVHGTA